MANSVPIQLKRNIVSNNFRENILLQIVLLYTKYYANLWLFYGARKSNKNKIRFLKKSPAILTFCRLRYKKKYM